MALYNVTLAHKAQIKYCDTYKLPLFAPPDGKCIRCGKNVYLPECTSDDTLIGISVYQAGRELITMCPHCHHSFVE